MLNYDDVAYANERLRSTIVKAEGRAFQILEYGKKETLGTFLKTGIQDVINSSKIDITPVQLGYVNFKGISSYITRCPVRKYKQGLDLKVNARSISGLAIHNLSLSSIADTIENVFPDFWDASEMVMSHDNIVSVAFSREFSLCKDGAIWYKGMFPIGTWGGKFYEVYNDFTWIGEALDSVLQ